MQLKAQDGKLLYGRMLKPANFRAGEKYPAVVMVYGGPGVQTVVNAWKDVDLAELLAARGFVVWELDNRGSAGRGHAFETPLYRRFGKTELADQLEGVRYLLAQGFVDPARVGIYGWSYGGFLTLYSLLNAPDVFRAGIAGAPVTNWRNYDTIYTERYLGLPSENPDGYRASSPVDYAAKLKAKLLIVHNFEDDNVLVSEHRANDERSGRSRKALRHGGLFGQEPWRHRARSQATARNVDRFLRKTTEVGSTGCLKPKFQGTERRGTLFHERRT